MIGPETDKALAALAAKLGTTVQVEKRIEVPVNIAEANAVLEFYLARARGLMDRGGAPMDRAKVFLDCVDKIDWWRTAVESLEPEEADVSF